MTDLARVHDDQAQMRVRTDEATAKGAKATDAIAFSRCSDLP